MPDSILSALDGLTQFLVSQSQSLLSYVGIIIIPILQKTWLETQTS